MLVDYTKMKVPELRDALTARGLPTNGLKNELISRLTSSDESASPAGEKPSASTPAPTTAAPAAHLPSADEEYEVDWEADDKPAAAPPATAPVAPTTPAPIAPAETTATTSASPAAVDTKPKRKTIASLFESPTAPAKSGNEPSSPSTVTDETSSAAPAPTPAAAPTPAFSANLPTTSLDEEITRRKKRAERFGLSAEESETLKSLERQKRFGIVEEKKEVKGLDEALPGEREKKRRGEPQTQQGRDGKRGRFEAAPQQQQQQGARRGGRARGPKGNGNGVVEGARVQKPSGGLSAEDKKRAEERRKRFAA